MNEEENLRTSFGNLKEDVNQIKKNLNKISKKLSNISSSIPQRRADIKAPIYTSKPFVNDEIKEAVLEVLDSGTFALGPKVKEFEEKFAEFCQIKYAVALSNGTIAIELALRALGIKEGDEIIVPSHTTMPTIEPILNLKAKPVFVDIEEKTYNINPKKIKITKKTKAIMPVHLYGNSASIEEIKNLCDKHKLFLIEDCSQAHNARYEGKHVGTFGDIGCFSFYPTKNLTVLGEGGMIITNNPKIEKKVRAMRNHGEEERYNHTSLGGNYRMSEIHAAIGIKQLELLPFFTRRRRQIAELYNSLLKDTSLKLPQEQENSKHSYHLYVIRVQANKRDKIIQELKKHNIYLGIHYPIPCHKQKVITDKFKSLPNLPITEKIAKEIIYPSLKNEEVEFIAKKLKEVI